jgi:hypothetical protein
MPPVNPLNPASLPSIESFTEGGVSSDDLMRLPKSVLNEPEGDTDADEGDEEGSQDAEGDANADDGSEGGDQGEEGGEEGEEGGEQAASDDTTPVKFKAGDEEVETTLGDLKAKYVEFTKLEAVAQELHGELQQVGGKVHQLMEKQRTEYTDALGKFNQWIMTVVAPEFDQRHLDALAEKDPAEYVKQQARIQRISQVLQGIQQEQERQGAHAKEEGQKARASAVQQSKQVLAKAIPGWNDQLYGEVLSSAVKHYAFKADEIGAVIDPRLVKMAHDAAQWQKLQNGKSVTQKKVEATPKRVTKPGQGRMDTKTGGKTFSASKQLRRTGSDADAVKLLMSKGIR